MLINILEEIFFSVIAAIGFTSISNPPRRVYPYSAFIAAVGRSIRYVLINNQIIEVQIILASSVAAFCVGLLAVYLAPKSKCPAETCLFPALLPMIPGMYAYKAVEALILCLYHDEEQVFNHYFYLLSFNGFTCAFIVIGMVVGATIPLFIFKKTSFQATR